MILSKHLTPRSLSAGIIQSYRENASCADEDHIIILRIKKLKYLQFCKRSLKMWSICKMDYYITEKNLLEEYLMKWKTMPVVLLNEKKKVYRTLYQT